MSDNWTRWKMGESIDVLAKERGCTRERMRLWLKRLDEGRTVIALESQVRELREALEAALDDCTDGDGNPVRYASMHWVWDARALLKRLPASAR